jgi:phospholipid/cholesterol/gamma-HCH transport system substrate-binding protein
MATTTHVKLGLLTLITVGALVVVALVLGLRKRPHDSYYTYFDETVQGLDVGAQVKYRGVRIGSVAAVGSAPDHRHVRVELAIDRSAVRAFELDVVAPQLRAQLVLVGITGLKIVDLDVVDPAQVPAPALTFRPAEPYIPSRPSLLKGVEAGLQATSDRLPLLIERMLSTLEKIESVIDEVGREGIPQRVAAIVGTAQGAVADLRRVVRRLDRAEVPEKLATAVDRFDRAATQLNQLLAQVDGADGLVASARRATDSVGELGRRTLESTGGLDDTLRDLGDAARAVRAFMEQLEREPDMLVKGRARTDAP